MLMQDTCQVSDFDMIDLHAIIIMVNMLRLGLDDFK